VVRVTYVNELTGEVQSTLPTSTVFGHTTPQSWTAAPNQLRGIAPPSAPRGAQCLAVGESDFEEIDVSEEEEEPGTRATASQQQQLDRDRRTATCPSLAPHVQVTGFVASSVDANTSDGGRSSAGGEKQAAPVRYVIQATAGGCRWLVARRFSEIYAFINRLKASQIIPTSMASLAAEKVPHFASQREQVATRRVPMLDRFLGNLVARYPSLLRRKIAVEFFCAPSVVRTELFFEAVRQCDSLAVADLLSDGQNPSAVSQINGLAPLHEACRQGDEAAVSQLLAHGADPDLAVQSIPLASCSTLGLPPHDQAQSRRVPGPGEEEWDARHDDAHATRSADNDSATATTSDSTSTRGRTRSSSSASSVSDGLGGRGEEHHSPEDSKEHDDLGGWDLISTNEASTLVDAGYSSPTFQCSEHEHGCDWKHTRCSGRYVPILAADPSSPGRPHGYEEGDGDVVYQQWSQLPRGSGMHTAQEGSRQHVAVLAMREETCRRYNGWCPMHFAAAYGHPGVLRALVEYHANVNHRSKSGHTPLLLAAQWNHTDCVKLLASNPRSKTGIHVGVASFESRSAPAASGLDARECTLNGRSTAETPMRAAARGDPACGDPAGIRRAPCTHFTSMI